MQISRFRRVGIPLETGRLADLARSMSLGPLRPEDCLNTNTQELCKPDVPSGNPTDATPENS